MRKKIDLLLVNPGNRLEQFSTLSPLATIAQPLGIAVLAAYLREQGFSVDIFDAEAYFMTPEEAVDEIEETYDPMAIGLTAFTTKMTAAGRILALVKERMPSALTLIGGHHPSAIPTQTLSEEAADFVIKGEGFFPTAKLIQALKDGKEEYPIQGVWYKKNGEVVNNGQAVGIQNLDNLPFPAWDLLPMEKYRAHHWQAWDYSLDQSGFSLIYTSLGCPFDCDYCSVNVVYESHLTRYRSPESVVAEMKILVERYGVKHIEIIDDTFTLNYKRVAALCDAITESGLGKKVNMWCFARTDRTDPDLMAKMKKSGINWVFMGFESGSDTVLQGVHKRQTVSQIREAVENVYKAGIHIGGNFVFGLPEDTMETMEQTLNLALELIPEYSNFFMMMAYPGTKLRQVALEKKYPLPQKWGQYGFFAPDSLPMRNDTLSAEDIIDFRDRAFEIFYHSPAYQARVKEVFGPEILEFLNSKVLSKKISRVHRNVL